MFNTYKYASSTVGCVYIRFLILNIFWLVFRLILLSSIYFGLQKKPPTVTSADWNACKAIFKLTSLDPLPVNLEETTDVLISSVENLVTGREFLLLLLNYFYVYFKKSCVAF